MDFSELDRMFDASLERLENKKPEIQGVYDTHPLAEDHFLLKKSWAYFKERVAAIEQQWAAINVSKEKEIQVLKRQIAELNETIETLQDRNRAHEDFEETVKKERLHELSQLESRTEALKASWLAEREAIEREVFSLRFKLDEKTRLGDDAALRTKIREKQAAEAADTLKNQMSLLRETQSQLQNQFAKTISEKDAEIELLGIKIDRLRAEVDRRDGVIHDQERAKTEQRKINDELEARLSQAASVIGERDREVENLKLQLDILKKENQSLRTNWEREQAQWRELWDRGREAWDKQRSALRNLEEKIQKEGGLDEKS